MKLDKDQIIRIICTYEQELINNYVENRDAFGLADYSTQRAVEKWLVVEELMQRLELKIND
jgi:hypothetical protein